jgi:hypothetical protein
VYKVIDDETTPGGIVYNKTEDVIEHFKSWLENTSQLVCDHPDEAIIRDKPTERFIS